MQITINTIGDLIDNGERVTAFCDAPECRHSQRIDLKALAQRLGRDFVYVGQLTRRLVCSSCGGREISIILLARGTDNIGRPHAGH